MGSPLDTLLQSYGRLPVPTREEQILLGRKIRAWLDWQPSAEEQAEGITEPPRRIRREGERAREQMVSRNMMLVATQARAFSVSSTPALEPQDLIQEGALGLCRAAELFDPAAGYAFSTYAVLWIRQSMTRLVHGSGSIRIPVKRAQAMHGLQRWCATFKAQEGRLPTDAEQLAAGLTGVQRPNDLRILREAAAVYHMRSLDALMGDEGDDDSWLSSIAAPWEDEDERARRKALERQTAQVLVFLEPWPELQEVLQRHLGGQSSREISLAMGISQHAAILRIKQAQAKAARWPGPGAHREACGAGLGCHPPAYKTASAPEADTSASASNRLAYFQPSLLTLSLIHI